MIALPADFVGDVLGGLGLIGAAGLGAAGDVVSLVDDNAVTLNMRCCVNRDDYWGVISDLTKAVKQALDASGISIPYPQRDVHVTNKVA